MGTLNPRLGTGCTSQPSLMSHRAAALRLRLLLVMRNLIRFTAAGQGLVSGREHGQELIACELGSKYAPLQQARTAQAALAI